MIKSPTTKKMYPNTCCTHSSFFSDLRNTKNPLPLYPPAPCFVPAEELTRQKNNIATTFASILLFDSKFEIEYESLTKSSAQLVIRTSTAIKSQVQVQVPSHVSQSTSRILIKTQYSIYYGFALHDQDHSCNESPRCHYHAANEIKFNVKIVIN